MAAQPTPEDRFSFGLWTIGWQARDPFGDATRPPLDPVESVHRLAELGALASASTTTTSCRSALTDGERERLIKRFRAALEETGHGRADGDDEPVLPSGLQGRCVHEQQPVGAQVRVRKVMRNLDLAAELGARDLRLLGRPGGLGDRRREGCARRARPLPRGPRHPGAVCDRPRYGIRFALEPKPNEPRGDILLPTIGHAVGFITTLEHSDMVGLNPEVGHEQMAGLNFVHGIAQALWQGKLFHIDLNGQRGREVRPGSGVRARRPDECVLPRRPARERRCRRRPRVRRAAPLRLQAAAHRRHQRRVGVRGREHAHLPPVEGAGRVWRSDPEVQEALAESQARARRPTLAAGETIAICSPIGQPSRTSTPMPSARRATASCVSASSPSSTCSARARPPPTSGRPPSVSVELFDVLTRLLALCRLSRRASCRR